MKRSSLMAMLEDAGYRIHEQGQLTRHYVVNVLMHKRSKEGQLLVEYHEPPEKPMTHAEELASLFRKRGHREWRIPQLVREQLAREATVEAERKAEKLKRRQAAQSKARTPEDARALAELQRHGRDQSQPVRQRGRRGPGTPPQ
jgi:hypothetical protein